MLMHTPHNHPIQFCKKLISQQQEIPSSATTVFKILLLWHNGRQSHKYTFGGWYFLQLSDGHPFTYLETIGMFLPNLESDL